MVDFQGRIMHRETIYACFQCVIIHRPEIVQSLVVYADRQDEVLEQLVVKLFSPRHLSPGLQRHFSIGLKKIFAIIALVSDAHVLVKETYAQPLRTRIVAVIVKANCFSVICLMFCSMMYAII